MIALPLEREATQPPALLGEGQDSVSSRSQGFLYLALLCCKTAGRSKWRLSYHRHLPPFVQPSSLPNRQPAASCVSGSNSASLDKSLNGKLCLFLSVGKDIDDRLSPVKLHVGVYFAIQVPSDEQ